MRRLHLGKDLHESRSEPSQGLKEKRARYKISEPGMRHSRGGEKV